jgi:hypothetical protein
MSVLGPDAVTLIVMQIVQMLVLALARRQVETVV